MNELKYLMWRDALGRFVTRAIARPRGEFPRIVLSISGKGRPSPLVLGRNLNILLEFRSQEWGPEWSAIWEEYVEEGDSAARIGGSGVLADPGVPPLVRSPVPSSNALIVEALKRKGHSEVHTAAREKKLSGLPVPSVERRIWPSKIKDGCEPWSGQSADPTLHPKGMDPYLTGSRSE